MAEPLPQTGERANTCLNKREKKNNPLLLFKFTTMLGNLGRLLTTSTRKLSCQHVMQATKRFASTSTIAQNNQQVVLDRALFQYTRKN